MFPAEREAENHPHTSQTVDVNMIKTPELKEYIDIFVRLFTTKTIELDNYRGVGMPKGAVLQKRLDSCDLSTVQGRIKYFRLKAGIMPNEMAQMMGIKFGSTYTNQYEFRGKSIHYSSLCNYYKLCEILNIDFEEIADEYLLFINSNYDELLKKAIDLSGLNSSAFAKKHGIEYTTLRGALKKKYKLSIETTQKYIKVLKSYGLY